MRRKLIYLLALCVTSGCCRQKPPASEPVADATPVKSQEVVMSDDAASGSNASNTPSTNPTPAASQPRQTTFTGILRGRILAVGAETTGWRLERDDGTRVDVSVSKVRDAVEGLDGKRVVIHGALTTANWTERGRRELIVAERVEAVAGDERK